jgi:hypothetical protein
MITSLNYILYRIKYHLRHHMTSNEKNFFSQMGAYTPTIYDAQFDPLWFVRSSLHRNFFMNSISY